MKMLSPILDENGLLCWRSIMDCAENIVITAHSGPDGDAIGSSLGLAEFLRQQGKNVSVVMPNRFPDFLRWMKGTDKIVLYDASPSEADRLIAESDVIFSLDYNSLDRADALGQVIAESRAKKIMVDHHLSPSDFADLMVSYPELSSTSELVFRLIWQMDGYSAMGSDAAAAIYCGMMTDTGAFAYNSSRPEIFYIIGRLLEKGIDKDKIYRNVYNNYSRNRVRLMGYILYRKLYFYNRMRACVYTLTQSEMKDFKFQKGDAEGLVNMPLMVHGMLLSIALREDTEKPVIRVSLRSVDDFPCNEMAARFFNGGGHLNAAGGELCCNMDEALKIAEAAVEAYRDRLAM